LFLGHALQRRDELHGLRHLVQFVAGDIRAGEHQAVDAIGIFSGIGHGGKASVAGTEQRDFLESGGLPYRLDIQHASGQRVVGRFAVGQAATTTVVLDNRAVFGDIHERFLTVVPVHSQVGGEDRADP
jgi:hypothetical protein